MIHIITMSHHLLHHLYNGIFDAHKEYDIALVVFIIIVHACIISLRSSFNFTIMKYLGENDKIEVLRWIIYGTLLDCIREFVYYKYSILYKTRIQLSLKQYFIKKYLNLLLLESNHDWLNVNKSSEINTAIDNGVDALMNTLKFSITIFNPLLQVIGSVWIIAIYVGVQIVVAFIVLALTFCGGIKLLEWEYNKRQQINKKTNPLKTYNTYLATTILPAILNNLGEKTINSIVANTIKKQELNLNITLVTVKCYATLELFGNITILLVVYFMSPTLDVSVLVAININLHNALDRIWWLFHMFHEASSTAANWSALEQYLISYVPENYHYKIDLGEYKIYDNITEKYSEYQICGKSGAGKSIFMLKEVIKLYRNYNSEWLYLDQQMSIPKFSCIKIRQYLCNFINENLHKSIKTEQTIIYWSTILQLTNIINIETLDKSFTSPSGGEIKRINILQMLLPIFMNQITIKLLFLDEITSGLDDETHNIVRKLIEKLKLEYGIRVINIDHHIYDAKQCKLYIKKIRDGECPYKVINEVPGKIRISWYTQYFKSMGFSYKYIKNIEEKKELSFPPEIRIDSFERD